MSRIPEKHTHPTKGTTHQEPRTQTSVHNDMPLTSVKHLNHHAGKPHQESTAQRAGVHEHVNISQLSFNMTDEPADVRHATVMIGGGKGDKQPISQTPVDNWESHETAVTAQP